MGMGMINPVGVLAASIVGMALGMIWHGPLFGKIWIKLMGITQKQMAEAQKKGMTGMTHSIVGQFVSLIITSAVMSFIVVGQPMESALMWVGMIWVGFVAQAQLTPVLWEKRSKELFLFSTTYTLALLLVMAAVLNGIG